MLFTDDQGTITETFSNMTITDVFKTHCLRRTKSEEAYYQLKAQNEVYALRRAKLFKLAEIVKEDFLDVLISKAEELAYQVVREKEDNFVLQLVRSYSVYSPELENHFETNRKLKMTKLMVLSDVLNDDFLDSLIALAEEGKQVADEEEEREWLEKEGMEGGWNAKRIEEERESDDGPGEESFHSEDGDEAIKVQHGEDESEDGMQESNEEKQFFESDSFASDNFFMNSD
ncbi:hypothetical protein LSTR_LSTR010830 [Laodelphax striatellus]|uniref:Uncharacterized protein n=1 Tax=Laodelphax striatellus TaxID=195883 RepID=A0A482WM80_LAOST|nr:hypothetical protein LSTR_LSTR010830 [Laodelphax striatellus]